MKLIIKPNTKDYQSYIECGANGFLLGLKHFSTGFTETYTLEEIEELKRSYKEQELFISINKMIFDEEIEELKNALFRLEQIKVTAVLFYDLAILELKQELNLKIDLVWNQTHMVTNYKTCNYYYEQGVHYALLSSELTLEEMIEIKQETNMSCMTLLYGYPTAAHSKRKLITNYYQFLEKPKKQELIVTEPVSKQQYRMKEDETGTLFYYNKCLNGTRAYLELLQYNFDYGVLKEEEDHEKFLEVLSLFHEGKRTKEKDKWFKKINACMDSHDTGFFYRKTIFKVKKHEKN